MSSDKHIADRSSIDLAQLSLILNINIAVMYNYLIREGYRSHVERELGGASEESGICVTTQEGIHALIRDFAPRRVHTDDVTMLIDEASEYSQLSSDERNTFWRPDIASKYVDMTAKVSELRKDQAEKTKSKILRNEFERLEGTGISVLIDKGGRKLYYRTRGNWIAHDKVDSIVAKNKKSFRESKKRSQQKNENYDPTSRDGLPF